MPRLVRDFGSPSARLVLIGESPGKWEDRQGIPFVGPAGQLLTRWWHDVGLQRSDFYITNTYPYRPPGDKIQLIPRDELELHIEQLHDRLAQLDDPWLIVPTGNTALYALTGQAFPPWSRKRANYAAPGITTLRGSIYEYEDRRGRRIKVIPTIHPAAIFRTPSWEKRCRLDWQRIAADATFRELRLPEREHFIRPSLRDVEDYLAETMDAEALSIDIETPREQHTEPGRGGRPKKVLGEPRIVCVGFSSAPDFSITVPTTLDYWKDKETLEQVWQLIRALCALPCEKVLQNGLFDAWWLARHRVRIVNYRWDTMGMHHCLDPADDHDLAYQASVFTRQPYWKDEAKDPDDISRYATVMDALWTYCGIDTAVQRELADTHHAALWREGLLDFYLDHYQQALAPLLAMALHGIAVDGVTGRRRAARLRARCIEMQDRLTTMAGEPLYGPKGSLSAKKLSRYLYETLGLQRQVDRKTQAVTTKEVVVRRLMVKYPKKINEAGQLILDHRRSEKLLESYDPKIVSPDGRVRTSFSFSPETGRLSSSKAPDRHGRNMQNTDRATRCLYLPDKGCLHMEADLSQAEDRIVKMYTRAPRLIERAQMRPWEYDEHRNTAVLIYRVAAEAVASEQRYLAKRGRHGANYGLQGNRLAEELLKDGYIYTGEECQRIIDAIHEHDPEIQDEYQRGIRRRIMRDRCLANTWGRVIDFSYERMDDVLYRRGYAWLAQSEPPAIINQWGLIPLYAKIQSERLHTRLHLQGHDSLLMSVPFGEAWSVASFLQSSLERPRNYAGATLVIPVEFKIGRWKCECDECKGRPRTVEFKRFPSRRDFDEAFRELLKT